MFEKLCTWILYKSKHLLEAIFIDKVVLVWNVDSSLFSVSGLVAWLTSYALLTQSLFIGHLILTMIDCVFSMSIFFW